MRKCVFTKILCSHYNLFSKTVIQKQTEMVIFEKKFKFNFSYFHPFSEYHWVRTLDTNETNETNEIINEILPKLIKFKQGLKKWFLSAQIPKCALTKLFEVTLSHSNNYFLGKVILTLVLKSFVQLGKWK
jgi:hypothetical protein